MAQSQSVCLGTTAISYMDVSIDFHNLNMLPNLDVLRAAATGQPQSG